MINTNVNKSTLRNNFFNGIFTAVMLKTKKKKVAVLCVLYTHTTRHNVRDKVNIFQT